MSRILVIDDEPQIGRMLKTVLSGHGYAVDVTTDGANGLALASSWQPDLIVLDLSMPLLDGFAVLQRLREWSNIPVIVLSVREGEADKVQALDLGADDYLTKPFGMSELLARLRVALRHATWRADQPACLRFGDLELDRYRRRVSRDGVEIKLTPTEYQLLNLLARSAGRVVTHHHLLTTIWGPHAIGDTPMLRVFINQLRKKIEPDPAKPQFIVTAPGIGYRFQDPQMLG